jgi:hypothetical protein
MNDCAHPLTVDRQPGCLRCGRSRADHYPDSEFHQAVAAVFERRKLEYGDGPLWWQPPFGWVTVLLTSRASGLPTPDMPRPEPPDED